MNLALHYQAMKPYIEIAEKTNADAMKLFEQEMAPTIKRLSGPAFYI